MDEKPKETSWSQNMRTMIQVGGVILAVVAGAAVGGLIGWALGDFGGRSDSESVWFLSLIIGAATGLAVAIALILQRARRIGWSFSFLVGAVSGVVAATAIILFVAWQRRP